MQILEASISRPHATTVPQGDKGGEKDKNGNHDDAEEEEEEEKEECDIMHDDDKDGSTETNVQS